jgi:hypothetical protein
METWCAQHRNTSDGFCERIQLQDQRTALAGRHLVLILKEWEERKLPPILKEWEERKLPSLISKPLDTGV